MLMVGCRLKLAHSGYKIYCVNYFAFKGICEIVLMVGCRLKLAHSGYKMNCVKYFAFKGI